MRANAVWSALRLWVLGAVLGIGALFVTIGVGVSQQARLRAEFVVPGAILPPQPRLPYLLGLVALGIALAGPGRTRLQMGVPLVVVAVGLLILRWLISLPASGPTWTYYAIKTLWLMISSLIWIGFAPALLTPSDEAIVGQTRHWRQEAAGIARAASWSGVALLLISFSSAASDPLPNARAGWIQPSARVVAEVVAAGNTYKSFVFWQWSDPGNERLGDFWAALAWDSTPNGTSVPFPPGLPGGLALWAYNETDSMSQLCTVLEAVPRITVITANSRLAAQLKPICPNTNAK